MNLEKTKFGLFPVLIVLFATYYLISTWGARFETAGYGILCASIVYVLAVILLWKGFRGEGHGLAKTKTWLRERPTILRENRHAVIFLLSLIVYVYAQTLLGFTLATAVAFLWFLWFMGVRQFGRLITLTAGLTALGHVILIRLLNVPLPGGMFGE